MNEGDEVIKIQGSENAHQMDMVFFTLEADFNTSQGNNAKCVNVD